MRPHHKESLDNLIEHYKKDPAVLGVVLTGSVARGQDRPDSDIDSTVVVTDEKYRELVGEYRTAECFSDFCTYEKGYYDIKYCTKDYLRAAAEKGSEPARHAFEGSRCVYAADPEIPGLVERIPVFQAGEREKKLLSFYAGLHLNCDYFWSISGENRYLRVRAATEVVMYGLRMILEEAGVLFSCQRDLFRQVEALENKPEGILDKAYRLLETFATPEKEAFVSAVLEFVDFQPPENTSITYARFIDDQELWWYKEGLFVPEW